MKLVIEWTTPEEILDKIAQLFYLMATSNSESLNDRLVALDGKNSQEELSVQKTSKKTHQAEVKVEVPEEEEVENVSPEEPEEELTLDELRAAFVEKNSPVNRPKLKAILTKLGVSRITQLKPDQFNEAYKMLEAI